VSEIATQWGFENPSHFNRLFKAEFGVPPSAVVADSTLARAEPASVAPAHAVELLHSWLRSSGGDA
jgi:AraC-like DNA-binding protein